MKRVLMILQQLRLGRNALWIWCFLGTFAPLTAQITFIPDPQFESHLIAAGMDTDGEVNGQVLTADIADETSLIILENGTQDLTGIEDFASLELLNLLKLNITNLDLSQNSNLRDLSLDNITLENLNVSNNLNLQEISLNLDTAQYPSDVSELDLSNNSDLEDILINGTKISHLSLVNNTNLSEVRLSNLSFMNYLDLKNGNNSNIFFLRVQSNPNLQCVQVDDPAAVIAGTDTPYDNWIIENDPLITDDCELGVAGFLEKNIGLYPNPVRSELSLEVLQGIFIKEISIYNVQGSRVLRKEGTTSLGVSSLSPGVYFMSIQTDKGMATKKFVKL
ncbi:T9SS type A sorting domain-containing protein [Aureisphaera sp.]